MDAAAYIKIKQRNIEWLRNDLKSHKDILSNLESLERTDEVEKAKENARADIQRVNENIMKELNGGLYEGISD